MEPRKKINIGFEIIVFGQILPHKIGVSDSRSPNSQIQFRYTPNTMPIKDGLLQEPFIGPHSVRVPSKTAVARATCPPGIHSSDVLNP